ncbi:MAG: 50S ribosomal protein L4 [Candidatus Gracilibacteria bacterium]|jgi:large subunit ribosomal protein L4
MKVSLFTQSGEKKGTLDLPKEIFEVKFNKDLVHQALVRQLANKRSAIAHTLTKAEVSGGGIKPRPQKGSGRSRQGSTRNPQWVGGGVAFGPRNNRNFTKDMPKKQRRQALFCALSEKARNEGIIGLEEYKTAKPKTKDFAALLKKLPIKRDVLIVLAAKDLSIQKSTRNLKNAKTILANYINIQDLQKYDTVLLFKEAVDKMKELFLTKSK